MTWLCKFVWIDPYGESTDSCAMHKILKKSTNHSPLFQGKKEKKIL